MFRKGGLTYNKRRNYMIQYKTGNIFLSNADCLVNTVNCEGFMGKGIAYQFKLKFPQNNENYINACKSGTLHIGSLYSFREKNVTIINFPTKNKWRENSRMSYIEIGLNEMIKLLPQLSVKSIAIPPLGCGNGGLSWPDVKKMIEDKLSIVEDKYNFLIYEPSENYSTTNSSMPKLNVESLLLMEIRMKLKKFTMSRLQAAAYFMNSFAKNKYFAFEKSGEVPHSRSIEFTCQKIRNFQKHFGLKDTKSTYQMTYNVICSKKTTEYIEKANTFMQKATALVNSKSDEELEALMKILFLIEKNPGISFVDITNLIPTDLEETYLSQLECEKLIGKDILGNYHSTFTE